MFFGTRFADTKEILNDFFIIVLINCTLSFTNTVSQVSAVEDAKINDNAKIMHARLAYNQNQ